jgi:hypothetical protein
MSPTTRLLDTLARPAVEAAADARLWFEERDVERLRAELDALPKLIAQVVERAYALGAAHARRAGCEAATPYRAAAPARTPTPAAKLSRSVARLWRACASPQDRARVLAALRMRERDLDRILAGRVRLAPAGWRRLWRGLGTPS